MGFLDLFVVVSIVFGVISLIMSFRIWFSTPDQDVFNFQPIEVDKEEDL